MDIDEEDHLVHGDEDDETGEKLLEIEEETLIRSLFFPRTSSIGSFSEVDKDDDVVSISSLHHDEEEVVGSVMSSVSGLKQTEKQLKQAEKKFLQSQKVRSSNVTLEELSSRFSNTVIPENPLADEQSLDKYMDNLVQNAVVDAVNTASPSMIGHMTSSLPYFMRPLSRLVTTMNQNIVKTETGNTITFLEREAMAQLHRQIYDRKEDFYKQYAQDPGSVLGVFTSGGTLANVTALWVARNVCLGKSKEGDFQGVEKEGLFHALNYYGYKGAAIIGSELLHYSMAKAADVLGLGVNALRNVPYDENYQVKIEEVEACVRECKEKKILIVAILGIAGATETGSIDDLAKLAKIAKDNGVHFHVDAAWGGPCIFSKKHRPLLHGIELADSVTLDGHKQLYMPMGCGLCFFKDPSLSLAVQKTARYIIRKDSYDLGKFTLEGSRPANAVFLHSNLNIFGVRGYEILVDRSIRMVKYMASRIETVSKGWFQLIVRPMTNILLYRCIPPHLRNREPHSFTQSENEEIDTLNITLQREQTMEGKTFVSRTTVRPTIFDIPTPVVALRVVIANPITFEADIDRVLQNQIDILVRVLNVDKETVDIPRFLDADDIAPKKHHHQQHTSQQPPPSPAPNSNSKYWSEYWNSMPIPVRNLFKGNKELFLSSLVAPELALEDGLFSK